MISDDKQYEFLTSQVQVLNERSVEAFKMFLQTFAAIVGGSIWLSLQPAISHSARSRFTTLSNAAVILLSVVIVVAVVDNVRAWRGYRFAMSRLGGKDESGVDRIKPPGTLSTAITEGMMLAGIVAVCTIFCAANPFKG